MTIKIRKARKKDLISILALIKELAVYEKAPKEVKVTVKELERDGFGRKKVFDCFVAEVDGSRESGIRRKTLPPNAKLKTNKLIIGIAIYYVKYSTWKGKCLFLEDLIVTESMRREGVGKRLFEAVVDAAKKMKVRKFEWQVLDWNKPAISFYKKYRTVFDDSWINCKLVFEK